MKECSETEDTTRCSPLKANRRCSAWYLLSRWYLARLILRPWRIAICSSETSVGFQRTTRRYIAEDTTLHNLKSYILHMVSFWSQTHKSRQLDLPPSSSENMKSFLLDPLGGNNLYSWVWTKRFLSICWTQQSRFHIFTWGRKQNQFPKHSVYSTEIRRRKLFRICVNL
jgi:hypothetical protein